MWRLGIGFPVYPGSEFLGGRMEGGGGESHDAAWERGERS